jgi:di/tricarboxylate transporter
MLEAPPPHAIGAILLTVAMFYGFISGRVRIEIISLLTLSVIALGLYISPLPGQAPTDGLKLAFEGFGHYALVTICALMIMGRGLVTTGALEPAARTLTKVWRFNRQLGLLVTLVLAMFMSMMVNDTPVIVLLLPILVSLAARGGMPASQTLIPVNSAVLIGGMATTIGTSTNLLVVGIATDMGLPPMGVFHFTPIVLMAAVVAIPFIWLVMPRLLPDNSPASGHEPRRFHATLRLGERSAVIGKSIETAKKLLPDGVRFDDPADQQLVAGARLGILATQEALEETVRVLGAHAAPPWLMERLQADYGRTGDDLSVVELAIAADSNLIGKRTTNAGIAENYNVAILGIQFAERLQGAKGELSSTSPMSEGDILLVAGTVENIQALSRVENLLMLEGMKEMPRTVKAPLALAIMAAAVIPASIGLVPIAISSLGGAILMFVTGCVKFDRVGRALSAKVIVLIAASIAIGKIVLDSGAAEWLSQLIALGLQFMPAAGVLATVMLFVTLLTNFASNATAAAVGTPIAFSLAQQLGIPVEPLVLAVLFGCNLCYATPVAYQTNMLIMSAGEYKFGDYTRTGLPLVALMIVTLSALLVFRYDLH